MAVPARACEWGLTLEIGVFRIGASREQHPRRIHRAGLGGVMQRGEAGAVRSLDRRAVREQEPDRIDAVVDRGPGPFGERRTSSESTLAPSFRAAASATVSPAIDASHKRVCGVWATAGMGSAAPKTSRIMSVFMQS